MYVDIYIFIFDLDEFPLPRQQFGVNLARERYYFLLVRKDCLKGNLEAVANETVQNLEKKFEASEPW